MNKLMCRYCQILLIPVLVFVALPLHAAYTFTISLSYSGCAGSVEEKIALRAAQAEMNYWLQQVKLGIPDKATCEQLRANIQTMGSEEHSYGGCRVRYICGPCTGSGGGISESPSVNVGAPSQGGSFFSSNPASEVRDWAQNSDALKRMLTGGQEQQSSAGAHTWTATNYANRWVDDATMNKSGNTVTNSAGTSLHKTKPRFIVIDKDTKFTGIPQAGMELVPLSPQRDMVSQWVQRINGDQKNLLLSTPDRFDQTMQSLFREKTGIDINSIILKSTLELTTEERQALGNYNEFVKQTSASLVDYANVQKQSIDNSEDKRQIDLAILAKDCYLDDGHQYLGLTDYKLITRSNEITEPSIRVVQNIINENYGKDGFQAEIYQNEVTGEYTIAFRGSEKELADWSTNIDNYTGRETRQYELAYKIGKALENLPDGVRVSITGHSLGGGLATVAGLTSGQPTLTVNAAWVNDQVVNKQGLSEKLNNGDYQITSLVATGKDSDMLDMLQTFAKDHPVQATSVIGGVATSVVPIVSIISPSNMGGVLMGGARMGTSIITGTNANHATGQRVELKDAGGSHASGPIVEHLLKTKSNTQNRWQQMNNARYLQEQVKSSLHLKGENYEDRN